MSDVRSIIFSPQDRARISEADIQRRRANALKGGLGGGMPLYIPFDDQKKVIDLTNPDDIGFLPVLPGEMVSIIARPGNGKTAFLMRTARERARIIREKAAAGDEDAKRRVVIYVTYEQPVEELNAFHLAASMSEQNRLSVTAMAMGKVSDRQMSEISRINTNTRCFQPLPYSCSAIANIGCMADCRKSNRIYSGIRKNHAPFQSRTNPRRASISGLPRRRSTAPRCGPMA